MPKSQYNVQEVAQLVTGDLHIHRFAESQPPPPDAAVSLQCPQCKALTWRYTRHCIHCRLDLVAWARRRRLWAPLRWIRAALGLKEPSASATKENRP